MRLALIFFASLLSLSAWGQDANFQIPWDLDYAFSSNSTGIHPKFTDSSLHEMVNGDYQEYKWKNSSSGFTIRAELTSDSNQKGKRTMYSAYLDQTEYGVRKIQKFSYDVSGNLYAATRCAPNFKNYLGIRTGDANCITVDKGVCGTLAANFKGKTFGEASGEIKQCSALFGPLKNLKKMMNSQIYKETAKSDRKYILSQTEKSGTVIDIPFGNNVLGDLSASEKEMNTSPENSKKAILVLASMLDECSRYFPNENGHKYYHVNKSESTAAISR